MIPQKPFKGKAINGRWWAVSRLTTVLLIKIVHYKNIIYFIYFHVPITDYVRLFYKWRGKFGYYGKKSKKSVYVFSYKTVCLTIFQPIPLLISMTKLASAKNSFISDFKSRLVLLGVICVRPESKHRITNKELHTMASGQYLIEMRKMV